MGLNQATGYAGGHDFIFAFDGYGAGIEFVNKGSFLQFAGLESLMVEQGIGAVKDIIGKVVTG